MNRINLIQEIFKRTNFQNYLEIGSQTGKSFLPIKAKSKTAIDPFFIIPLKNKMKWLLKVPQNFNNRYFEEESDNFFLKRKAYLSKLGQLDVVLVDGLHTFKASLNDVLNSLVYLNKDGIIVMHDCLPPHKAAALPYLPTKEEAEKIEGWTGQWTGDVWKTIVYLQKKYPDVLDVCVINTDYGLGIVRPKNKINCNELIVDKKLFEEIDRMTYEQLMENPEAMINLKDEEYAHILIGDFSAKE